MMNNGCSKMIESVVLTVDARSRTSTEEGCYRVFWYRRDLSISALIHGTYTPGNLLYYIAV